MNKYAKKWEKILQMTTINKEYWDKVGYYCDQYYDLFVSSESINALVLSLRVLGNIDLSKVIFTNLRDICNSYKHSIVLTHDQIMDIKLQSNINVIAVIENLLSVELEKTINNIIEKSGGIVVNNLCDKIESVKQNGLQQRVELTSFILPLDVYRIEKLKKLTKIIHEME